MNAHECTLKAHEMHRKGKREAHKRHMECTHKAHEMHMNAYGMHMKST
jgi:hypothetical protein